MEAIRGQTNQMFTAVVVPTLTEGIILRAFEWFDETLKAEPNLAAGTIVLIELMQKVSAYFTKFGRKTNNDFRTRSSTLFEVRMAGLDQRVGISCK